MNDPSRPSKAKPSVLVLVAVIVGSILVLLGATLGLVYFNKSDITPGGNSHKTPAAVVFEQSKQPSSSTTVVGVKASLSTLPKWAVYGGGALIFILLLGLILAVGYHSSRETETTSLSIKSEDTVVTTEDSGFNNWITITVIIVCIVFSVGVITMAICKGRARNGEQKTDFVPLKDHKNQIESEILPLSDEQRLGGPKVHPDNLGQEDIASFDKDAFIIRFVRIVSENKLKFAPNANQIEFRPILMSISDKMSPFDKIFAGLTLANSCIHNSSLTDVFPILPDLSADDRLILFDSKDIAWSAIFESVVDPRFREFISRCATSTSSGKSELAGRVGMDLICLNSKYMEDRFLKRFFSYVRFECGEFSLKRILNSLEPAELQSMERLFVLPIVVRPSLSCSVAANHLTTTAKQMIINSLLSKCESQTLRFAANVNRSDFKPIILSISDRIKLPERMLVNGGMAHYFVNILKEPLDKVFPTRDSLSHENFNAILDSRLNSDKWDVIFQRVANEHRIIEMKSTSSFESTRVLVEALSNDLLEFNAMYSDDRFPSKFFEKITTWCEEKHYMAVFIGLSDSTLCALQQLFTL